MNLKPVITASLLALACSPAWAACTKPTAPTIPDGSSTEKDAFYAAYQEAKTYLTEGEAYLTCLTDEEKAEMEKGETTEESQAARLDVYNEAVDEMQKLGEQLNAEVTKFKASQQ